MEEGSQDDVLAAAPHEPDRARVAAVLRVLALA
jgi:hypothetical protein